MKANGKKRAFINMSSKHKNKMVKKSIAILILAVNLLLVVVSGCSSNGTPAQSFEVKRGDFDIVVSIDGSLNMPNTFNLRFGTPGKVQDILVTEGDSVKAGALLAFLDNTAQKNAIRTALFNIQSAMNNIAVSCGVLSDLPNNYPELSAPRMFQEAQKDFDEFIGYFVKGQYKDAGFKLGMAYFDIDICQDLIASRVNPAALAGAKQNSVYNPEGEQGSNKDMWQNDAIVIDYLEKYQVKLLNLSRLMMQGVYEKIKPELDIVRQEMLTGNQLVDSTVHIRGRTYLTYPDIPTSLDFLQLSLRSLQDLDKYLAQGDTTQEEVARRIYTAKLNLLIGSDVLENQTLIYDWAGRSDWKVLQQYNLNLQSATIAFYKAKRDIMNTVIVAPVDGTVVSVDLKQGAILSAQDYSARPAIKLVDTSAIRFTGQVDEIDIMKIKTGQKAKITVDAVANKVLTGTVKFISPFGTKLGQVIRFAVTIELDRSDADLRGGLSATAEVNVYAAKNVLVVPVSMIITQVSGSIVMVINEATGQAEPRKVTLGKQSLQYAEVLDGLKEGEKIQVLNQKPTIQGGQQRPMPPPGMFR
jgi:multidrug efflux pump subunit AcrA (membrane-fusion protein)